LSSYRSEGAGVTSQLVMNMVSKGDIFRDVIAFETTAAQKGDMVERVVQKWLS